MNEKYTPLFQPLTLPNGVTLRNRFVLAPLTHVSSNEDGTISDQELPYIEKRSEDVGLAITAASNVTALGKAFPGQPSIARDSDIEGLRQQAAVMKKNGAKAVAQIHHGGAQSLPKLTPGGDVAAPSTIELASFGEPQKHHARPITKEEIEETIQAFGEATRRAAQAGFDGVEIHGANHYLIQQFVSPYYNRRDDEWADPFKFPLAVVDEVTASAREHGGDDFIVGYRFSPEEAESPGITMELTKELIDQLADQPLDYFHVSLMDIHSETREGPYYGKKRIQLIHDWIDGRAPLVGIGSIFTADDALSALETGTELVCLGRELLLDYQFVRKIQEGREHEINATFDPNEPTKYHVPEPLWQQLYNGFYPLPRNDG
ncbi:NADH-dependent flavin oxidoreductase [uncultured Marinococcus sp.]|jgi:2,4-dienoyl-CoA reductase-like NADH-dependent reductase (Old Yellow Enzyme family)|uniref:NADH-dependent flavin oxidoreductase n=1 Tax=uncultured Marinococcus sp. TaxID=487012 RepID=UPI0026238E2B|nr:NADH-dependent flavin oxidoreductase [uncultured Marinococcus sp.]